jgi:HEAT repeat protein
MPRQKLARAVLAASPAVLVGTAAVAQDNQAAVDKAFETLKTYDWGTDRNALNPIDQAVIATCGDADARKELETRLIGVLNSDASRSAKDFVCRTLRTIGTAESVPSLARLLPDKDMAHMARYALERIPAPEAAAALRDAVPNLSGPLKVGVIGSLGVRRDAASVPALVAALGDADATVASAAAMALGAIGTTEAGTALVDFAKKAPDAAKTAAIDACLACAEKQLAAGKKAQAVSIYKSLAGDQQPKHVRLAVQRGLLAAAGKRE